MYELLVLSILLTRNESGYRLRKIMEDSFMVERRVSNGVLYPLLQRLSDQDYVQIQLMDNHARKEKIISITERGRERVHELLEEPIKKDMNYEETLHLKLTLIDISSLSYQAFFYKEYIHYFEEVQQKKRTLREHLLEKYQGAPNTALILQSALSSIDLDIQIAETRIQFAKRKIESLNNES